jgi:hypothetical protein
MMGTHFLTVSQNKVVDVTRQFIPGPYKEFREVPSSLWIQILRGTLKDPLRLFKSLPNFGYAGEDTIIFFKGQHLIQGCPQGKFGSNRDPSQPSFVPHELEKNSTRDVWS